jgi:hypothetical protein
VYGIGGSFAVELVATFVWNSRQLCHGISGRFGVEYADRDRVSVRNGAGSVPSPISKGTAPSHAPIVQFPPDVAYQERPTEKEEECWQPARARRSASATLSAGAAEPPSPLSPSYDGCGPWVRVALAFTAA